MSNDLYLSLNGLAAILREKHSKCLLTYSQSHEWDSIVFSSGVVIKCNILLQCCTLHIHSKVHISNITFYFLNENLFQFMLTNWVNMKCSILKVCILFEELPVSWYSRQLVWLYNMPVMGSSLKWTVSPIRSTNYPTMGKSISHWKPSTSF